MAFEPRTGKRLAYVSEQRTKVEHANFMKMLADTYPDARSIVLVQDDLNTHTAGSFYEALSPNEAFRPAQRFEFHYTPKKGGWFNMAEIKLSGALKAMLRSENRISSNACR
jgi:DDE superfamily endonuclease